MRHVAAIKIERCRGSKSRFSLAAPWRLLLLLCLLLLPASAAGWDWQSLMKLGGGGGGDESQEDYLSFAKVSSMRVRDIKRRLARRHGYEAGELGKMLDKAELIEALSYEEHKLHMLKENEAKRWVLWRSAISAALGGLLVLFWPLLMRAYEVAAVNWVVYLDRKTYEARRCRELKSPRALLGILVMAVLDFLQLWLSASIIASWVISSSSALSHLRKYLFPTPHLPFRPAAYMGGEISKSQLANYGLNVGPMILTWALRFSYGYVQGWTGRCLRDGAKRQRREETPQERAERKAARKAARRAAREQAAAAAAAAQRDEINRRKQVAEQATAELFATKRGQPHPAAVHSTSDFDGNAGSRGGGGEAMESRGKSGDCDGEAGWAEEEHVDVDVAGDQASDVAAARRAFEEQVEAIDMDDLD